MAGITKIFALLLGSALLMFAGGLQGLLISIRGGAEGFSLTALGLIGAGWSAGFIAGTIFVPKLVARVGHIRAFSVMAAVASVAILFNLLVVEQYSWIGLRALSGFCFAGAAMIVESWLNEVSDSSRRGSIFALYIMTNLIFATAGQMAIAGVGTMTYLPFVIGAISFALAVLPTAMSASPQPAPLTRAQLNLGLLFRNSPLSVLASLAVGIAGGAFGTLAPVFGIRMNFDSATIAYLMSLSVVAGAVSQLPFGRMSDRMDRRIVMIITSLIAAVAGILMVIANPGPGVLVYVLFALYGLSANAIYPVAVAHANDHAGDNDFAAIASGLLLVFGIGLAAGPIFAAWAMEMVNPASLFLVTAAVHALLAGAAFVRMRMRPALATDDRSPFSAVPQGRVSTPETVALDPRSDEVPAEDLPEPDPRAEAMAVESTATEPADSAEDGPEPEPESETGTEEPTEGKPEK